MSELSLIVSLSVSKSYSVYCTTETVSGLQKVDLPSHLKNSEQASCADEQLYLCEEHGMSLLQLLLINLSISEEPTSNLLGSDTRKYAHDGPSDVTLVSDGHWPPFAQCVLPILRSGFTT